MERMERFRFFKLYLYEMVPYLTNDPFFYQEHKWLQRPQA